MARRGKDDVDQAMLAPWDGRKVEPTPIVRLTTLRVRTVARILKLREKTVYELCRTQVFASAYLEGKEWRVPAADVEAYQRQRQETTRRFLAATRAPRVTARSG